MALGTQELLENQGNQQVNAAYECEIYKLLGAVVRQGQRRKTVVDGTVIEAGRFILGNRVFICLEIVQ